MIEAEKQFREELLALLEKYDVEICWDYSDCSDTHGMYGEGIEFTTGWRHPKETAFRFVIEGQCVDKTSLKEEN